MNKAQMFLRRHSSTILTVVGSAGVVTTAVLAVKATPKALELIEEEKNRQNRELFLDALSNDWEMCSQIDKLKPLEVVKVAWKPYIPAAVTGLSTIACIFGANYLNARKQATLMSAYAVLDSAFKEYREKTKELYSDNLIDQEIVKSKFDKSMVLDSNKELFYDMQSMQYFESTMEEVEQAEDIFNQNFTSSDSAYLNEFLELLDIPLVDFGYDIGWCSQAGEMKFIHDKIVLEDGLECTIITMDYPPSLQYNC